MDLLEKYYERDELELTKAEEIVFDIIDELNGRKGVGIGDIDYSIQVEILETLVEKVEGRL